MTENPAAQAQFDGLAVQLDGLAEWLAAYDQAAANVKQWEEIRDRAKERITEALGTAETGTVDGAPVVRWSYVSRDVVDVKKLREQFPDVAEQFTRTTMSRRFTRVDGAA